MQQNDAEKKWILEVRPCKRGNQRNISQLRKKIELSNLKMLQLTNNDQKFTEKIFQLNENGVKSIQSQEFQEALVYLGQAQKLLQYSASCGSSIDRQIILKILNNQAVAYQRNWDIQHSMSYIEAIIFNLQTFLNSKENQATTLRLGQVVQGIQNSSLHYQEAHQCMETCFLNIKTLIQNKFTLALYYLQFSSLNSQNQDHLVALSYGKKAVRIYKQTFSQSLLFIKIKHFLGIEPQCQNLLHLITQLPAPRFQEHDCFISMVQQIRTTFQNKSHTSNSFNYLLQKYSSLQKKQIKYRDFTLNKVMQLRPRSFEQKILDRSDHPQSHYHIEEIQNSSKLTQKILEYAVGFYTLSEQVQQIRNQNNKALDVLDQMTSELEKVKLQKEAEMYYIISLKISVVIVEQLSQFSKFIFKRYFQLYNSPSIKNSGDISKMDALKQKYKSFLPKPGSHMNSFIELEESEESYTNKSSEYKTYVKVPETKQGSKRQKQNKLEMLLKQAKKNSPQMSSPAPPKLKIDVSLIQSLQYGGSRITKQINQAQNRLQKPVIIQEQQDTKQTKKSHGLNTKKVKTVPILSDLSQNNQQGLTSRQKSSGSKVNQKYNQIKSKSKLHTKVVKFKVNTKNNLNSSSKNKILFKKQMSPRNFNTRQPHNTYNQVNQTHVRKKVDITQKKVLSDRVDMTQKKAFSDRKVFLETQRINQKLNNKIKFKKQQNNKKKNNQVSPESSRRKNTQLKGQFLNYMLNQQNLIQKKKAFKLRKAKSFEQVINLYEDVKPIINKSKKILNQFNTNFKSLDYAQQLKYMNQSNKTKSSENLKFTVKKTKKQKRQMYTPKDDLVAKNTKHATQIKHYVQKGMKQSGIPKKSKKTSIKQKSHSLIAIQPNAVRMSSVKNLINSVNQKHNLKNSKSSKSLYQSCYKHSSGYLLKGLQNSVSQQKTKAGLAVMLTSVKQK